jgi:hypothetical protein
MHAGLMRGAVAVCIVAICVAAAAPLPSSTAATEASRVVDRTFSCAPGYLGGVYSITARARTGVGRTGSVWEQPPLATVGSSLAGVAQFSIQNSLAWISAGQPAPTAPVSPADPELPLRAWGTVGVQAGVCRGSAARVPVGTRGLLRAAVGPFEETFDCDTPRRVLVRVRATLTATGALTSFHGYLRATVPARTAEVMVRTPAGKPVAFVRVQESGKASLFAAPGCVED